MPDNSQPSSMGRKRALIGPLVVLLILGVIVAIAVAVRARREAKPSPPPQQPLAQAPAASIDLPPPPLTRADLVRDAASAASAYAVGANPPRFGLVRRRFVVRIPFGCNGPGGGSPSAQADVELDPDASALTLTARPSVWTSLPALQNLPNAGAIETVEGFWIPRPWVDSESCPPVRETPLPATPTPAAAQTVGLARMFEKGVSRVSMRADKPYQVAIKLPKGDGDTLRHTYRLVLEGRLVDYGDGRAIHCWSESPDHRPICLFAVDYDRVAFEDAQTGDTLAQWRE